MSGKLALGSGSLRGFVERSYAVLCYSARHVSTPTVLTPLGGCCMTSGFVCFARRARPAVAAALVALAACGGGDDTTNPQGARAITRVSPDSQTTAAGVKMAQPLVVLVTGSGDAPVGNVAVSWAVGAGGGTVSDTSSTTDAAG